MQALDEAEVHAKETAEGGYLAEVYRVRGELLLKQGDAAAAEQALQKAIDYARNQRTKSFELRAATSLARLLKSAGRGAEARAALQPVYDWFTEGHNTADLVDARTLLCGIG
jgi:predicted ATPase